LRTAQPWQKQGQPLRAVGVEGPFNFHMPGVRRIGWFQKTHQWHGPGGGHVQTGDDSARIGTEKPLCQRTRGGVEQLRQNSSGLKGSVGNTVKGMAPSIAHHGEIRRATGTALNFEGIHTQPGQPLGLPDEAEILWGKKLCPGFVSRACRHGCALVVYPVLHNLPCVGAFALAFLHNGPQPILIPARVGARAHAGCAAGLVHGAVRHVYGKLAAAGKGHALCTVGKHFQLKTGQAGIAGGTQVAHLAGGTFAGQIRARCAQVAPKRTRLDIPGVGLSADVDGQCRGQPARQAEHAGIGHDEAVSTGQGGLLYALTHEGKVVLAWGGVQAHVDFGLGCVGVAHGSGQSIAGKTGSAGAQVGAIGPEVHGISPIDQGSGKAFRIAGRQEEFWNTHGRWLAVGQRRVKSERRIETALASGLDFWWILGKDAGAMKSVTIHNTPILANGRTAWKTSAGAFLLCAVLSLLFGPLFLPTQLNARSSKPRPAAKVTQADAAATAKSVDKTIQQLLVQLGRKTATRESLKKISADLEAAHGVKLDGATDAKALYFQARAEEEIGKLSSGKDGGRDSWQKSEDLFTQFLDHFPKHPLVPDALLTRGFVRLRGLDDPDGALVDFRAMLKDHPKHGRISTAKMYAAQAQKTKKNGVKRQPDLRPESRSDSKSDMGIPSPSELPPPPVLNQKPRGQGGASLVQVRYKTGSDYTRVVLDVDMPIRFKYQLLDGHGSPVNAPAASSKDNKPALLYLDLLHTQVARSIPGEVKIAGGILRTLRCNQFATDTARIVLDFEEMHDYKVFALENPFRLVVDVYAAPTAKGAKTSAKSRPAPVIEDMPEEPDPPAYKGAVKGGIRAPKGNRKRMATDLVEQLGLTVRTIMIDAGHGGKDPGAHGNGLQEKDVNLRMALILGKVLKAEGFKVVYTRTTDVFLPLEERTARANVRKVDLFLSVHCNAHTDTSISGLETYSLNLARTPDAVRVAARENAVSDKSISDLQMILTDLMLNSKIKESLALARGVQQNSLDTLRKGKFTINDHGNREAPFYVLMGAKMPSALVEIGYITNPVEAGRLKNDNYLRTLARGIADGVLKYKAQIERYAGQK